MNASIRSRLADDDDNEEEEEEELEAAAEAPTQFYDGGESQPCDGTPEAVLGPTT